MCFSAQADLLAGMAVGAIGIDALRHVRRPAERALAAVPAVLAGHLLVEAFVWWGLQDRVPSMVWRPAMWLYLVIALGVLPVLVPVAVGALEPITNRRQVQLFTIAGVGVAAVLLQALVRGPVEAAIQGHHIAYTVQLWHAGVVALVYVLVTCGPMLASKHAHVRWFGAINVVAAGLIAWIDKTAFISLWCSWATLTSVAIAIHLRYASPPPRPAARAARRRMPDGW